MNRMKVGAPVILFAMLVVGIRAMENEAAKENKPMQASVHIPEIDIAASKIKTRTATFALG